jgi:protein-export membrane protein SecD
MPTPVARQTPASIKKRALAILLLALPVAALAYPPAANLAIDGANRVLGTKIGHLNRPFLLGLDLQGGTRLEYEADVSGIAAADRADQIAGVRDLIERRVNALGVSEPVVQTARAGDAYRVSVELAGIRDVNEAIKTIGETPTLEFKEQNTEPPKDLTDEEKKTIETRNAASLKQAQALADAQQKDPDAIKKAIAASTSTSDTLKQAEGDLGFIKDNPVYADIYNATKGFKAGQSTPKPIEVEAGYFVAKAEEVKAAANEIRARHILLNYAGATGATSSTTRTKEDAKKQIEEIRKQVNAKNFADLAKQRSEDKGSGPEGGDLGWFGPGVMVESFEKPALALKKGEISAPIETEYGFHIIYKEDERSSQDVRVRVMAFQKWTGSDIRPNAEWKSTGLSGKNLKRAQLAFDPNTGRAEISLEFDEEGRRILQEVTQRNLGKPLAIFIDNQIEGYPPTVSTVIPNGQARITGDYTPQEAKLKAQRMQQGALPVPITLIAQQSVGPTLGADSVQQSLNAGLVGFLLVALFMVVVYRIPGLMSVVSLVLYAGISFALFKTIPVTLTLAGISGFILSLGIALDANVLVFERLKEESAAGKSWSQALEEAFRRAWTSIRDGNSTTLISCLVLYSFSSSIIKGFALTLAVGILVSLFTSIVVTRTLLRLVALTKLPTAFPRLFLGRATKS